LTVEDAVIDGLSRHQLQHVRPPKGSMPAGAIAHHVLVGFRPLMLRCAMRWRATCAVDVTSATPPEGNSRPRHWRRRRSSATGRVSLGTRRRAIEARTGRVLELKEP
jgi:hypothetical protein